MKRRDEEKSAPQEENHNITPVVQCSICIDPCWSKEMIPWLNLSSCEDGCCLFQGKVFNQTISNHVSNGIATITTSARAESVGVSPILAKTTLGGQT